MALEHHIGLKHFSSTFMGVQSSFFVDSVSRCYSPSAASLRLFLSGALYWMPIMEQCITVTLSDTLNVQEYHYQIFTYA
jgi:hypothetical protein